MWKNIRYVIITWFCLILISVIGINAILTNGNRVLKDINYNELISTRGYHQKKNNFKLKNGKGYIEVPKVDGATAIYVETDNVSNSDVVVQVDFNMNDGLISKGVKQGLWNSNEHYFVVDVVDEGVASYVIHINHDIKLSKIYYIQPDISPIQKGNIFVMSLPISFLFALLLVVTHVSEKLIKKILNNIKSLNDKLRSKLDKKSAYKSLILVILSIILIILLNLLFVRFVSHKFSKKSFLFICNVVFLLDVFILFLQKKIVRLETIACLLILSTGAMISFSEPTSLGMIWDDLTHFNRSESYTHIIDQKQSEANIAMEDNFVLNASKHSMYSWKSNNLNEKKLNNLYRNKLYRYYNDQNRADFKYDKISYIVPATGILLARGLNLPFTIIVAFGRFADVIMLSICAYFSIKNLRSGKIVMMLMFLLPTVTITAANYNYDTWILAFTLLGSSYFIKELENDSFVDPKNTIKMVLFTLIGIAPKLIYFPILFLYFFMPKGKFMDKQKHLHYVLIILLSLLLPLIIVLINNVVKTYISGVRGEVTGDMKGGFEGVNSGGQILYILHNPIDALKILVSFLVEYLNPFIQGSAYTVSMAYLNPGNDSIKQLGNYFVLLIFINSLLTNSNKESVINNLLKIMSILLYVGVGSLCALALYISFTPVAHDTVLGCQGRYLLPVLFIPIYMLGSLRIEKLNDKKVVKIVNIITIALFLGVTLQQYWINYIII